MKRVLLLAGIILSLISAPAFAGTLPDTGQTACYDNEAEIACPLPGEPFYGQDAQYEAAAMSYTKLGHGGVELPDNATEWSMVRVNVTGLEWENKTDNGTIHDKDNLYAWHDAEDIFIDQINIDNFGGHSDWRVPELKELAMLVDSSIPCSGPTIDTAYFMPSQAAHYWSKDHGDWLVEWGPSFVLVYAVDFSTGAARAILFMDFYNCPDPPEFQDFGDATLLADNGATFYFRVDWFTPAGLGCWGDGRTVVLGTDGYIELRKSVDIARDAEGDHVYVVDHHGERHLAVHGQVGFPYFGQLIRDCLDRTETAMTQPHTFLAAELALKAQAQAMRVSGGARA